MGLAVLAIAAALAAGTTPVRTCDTRIQGAGGSAQAGDVTLGPLVFFQLARFADPRRLERFHAGDHFTVKAPVGIKAGKVVSLSVRGADARLDYASPANPSAAVRMVACGRSVGRVTVFAGGFRLTKPACVKLVARLGGTKRVYRKMISFGMRDRCI